MGRRLKADLQESAEKLEGLYRDEKHYQRWERLLIYINPTQEVLLHDWYKQALHINDSTTTN